MTNESNVDWEAIAAEQALDIALLKSDLKDAQQSRHAGRARGGEMSEDIENVSTLNQVIAERNEWKRKWQTLADFHRGAIGNADAHIATLREQLAAAQAECLRRQTIIGEVALERDAARALLMNCRHILNAYDKAYGRGENFQRYDLPLLLSNIDAALRKGEAK